MSFPTDVLLRLEMQELQDRYMATIDSDNLEDWPGFFVEDCLYEIIPKENVSVGLLIPIVYCDSAAMLRDRVISLRHANIYSQPCYRHFSSGLTSRKVDEDRVEMTSSYLVINTTKDGESQVYQAGQYQDIVVRTEQGWRFQTKRAIYDTSRVQTLLAYPI